MQPADVHALFLCLGVDFLPSSPVLLGCYLICVIPRPIRSVSDIYSRDGVLAGEKTANRFTVEFFDFVLADANV